MVVHLRSRHVLVAKCGRTESNNDRPFNSETLKQHEHDCPVCNPIPLRVMRLQQAYYSNKDEDD